MKLNSEQPHIITAEVLEEQYFTNSCYCTLCERFYPHKIEPGEVRVCPICGTPHLWDTETAINVGVLESTG